MNDTALPVQGFALLITASLLVACGSDGEDSDAIMDVVPVTVQELRETDYGRDHRLTGSVGLYREEQIGFEVAGRIISVLDEVLRLEAQRTTREAGWYSQARSSRLLIARVMSSRLAP